MEQHFLDEKYWDDRYNEHTAVWDAGKITEPLKEYINQLTDKNIAILIPGCGNAHEAEYLLENGFTNITLIDIAPGLVKSIREKLKAYDGKQLTVICDDFFNLDKQFDLIIEQTFFCALDPVLRKKYAEKMFDILKPGGKLAGVLFNRSFEGGPPFGGSKDEYEELFSKRFEIKTMELCYNSIAPRSGNEVFIIFTKPSI
ncbi:MAG: methyltransferase domain-containing protein [Ferruginibacter sp.]